MDSFFFEQEIERKKVIMNKAGRYLIIIVLKIKIKEKQG
jgi:hypothetical protein